MITVRKLAIGVGALSAMASVAHAQDNVATASATATSSATIIQPITASSSANLAFGTIVKPTGATVGTVSIDPTGGRTLTNVIGVSSGGAGTAASFSVVGEGGQAYSVSVPPNFSLVSGSSTLTVTTSNNAAVGANLSNTIGSPGSATFGVGGSFSLNSATASGNYTGTIQVIASYQ